MESAIVSVDLVLSNSLLLSMHVWQWVIIIRNYFPTLRNALRICMTLIVPLCTKLSSLVLYLADVNTVEFFLHYYTMHTMFFVVEKLYLDFVSLACQDRFRIFTTKMCWSLVFLISYFRVFLNPIIKAPCNKCYSRRIPICSHSKTAKITSMKTEK